MKKHITILSLLALFLACGMDGCKKNEGVPVQNGKAQSTTPKFSGNGRAFVLSKEAGPVQSGVFCIGYQKDYANIPRAIQKAVDGFSEKNNVTVGLQEVDLENPDEMNVPVICVDANNLNDAQIGNLWRYATEKRGVIVAQNAESAKQFMEKFGKDAETAEGEFGLKSAVGKVDGVSRILMFADAVFNNFAWDTTQPRCGQFCNLVADSFMLALTAGGMVEKIETPPLEIAGALTEKGVVIRVRANQAKGEEKATLSLKLLDARNKCFGDNHAEIAFDEKSKENSFDFTTDPIENAYLYRVEVEYVVPAFTLSFSRTLAEIVGVMNVKLLGQNEVFANSLSSVRVIALNERDNSPIPDAEVVMTLFDGATPISSFSGRTDATGTLELLFKVGDVKAEALKMEFSVKSVLGHEKLMQDLKVKRAFKILLNTDKPIYKPGQMMHIRALALQQPSMLPVSGRTFLMEIEDSKGNKLFKKELGLSEFGIAGADFQLADEINMGTWTVRGVIDEKESQEKKVEVKRYVLPKFKIDVKPEKTFYMPGDVLKGGVQADYHFGKPVAEGAVKIDFVVFEAGETVMGAIEGKTDRDGHFEFEYKLQDYFVGHPLAKGDAPVILNVAVTDTAEQKVEKSATVTVSKDPIRIYAIPESGSLVSGVENIIYLMSTYPDGSPAEGAVFTVGDKSFKADELGIATIAALPTEQRYAMTVGVKDGRGASAETEFTFDINAAEEQVLLRLDKVFTKVGETLNATVFSSHGTGSVYLDIIRDGQTVLTRAMDIEKGRATASIDLDSDYFGTLIVNAYQINRTGQVVRDTKSLYVARADDLNIAVTPDKDTYLPGGEANFDFTITGTDGRPLLAALGVIIVDEAVYALSEMQPGLEKIYFTLEKEIMKPRYEIHGFEPDPFIINPVRPDENARLQAAQVLAASVAATVQYSLDVNTGARKFEEYQDTLKKIFDEHLAPMVKAMQDWAGKASRDELDKMSSHRQLLEALLKSGALNEAQTKDPWGGELVFPGWYPPDGLLIYSKGPDGVLATNDDVFVEKADVFKENKVPSIQKWDIDTWRLSQQIETQVIRDVKFGFDGMRGMLKHELLRNVLPAAGGLEAEAMADAAMDKGGAMPPSEGGAKPRLRQFFPETLYFNAQILTDANGRARLTIPMADNITTWRMSTFASGLTGQLGSSQTGIRVFQDFFIDMNLPVALTQNDYVEVPVAVYNYLKQEQKITLTIERDEESWFELTGDPVRSVTLGPDKVGVARFPVKALKVGFHSFTVLAEGDAGFKDYIRQSVSVEPDGKMFEQVQNGKLSSEAGKVEFNIDIPQEAIPDAYKIFVKIYPGVMAQVQEGLDSMLQMPCGCFEQTSSSTYPNVLILDYMKRTKKITPEIQMKAEGFVSLGYQRLVAFEVNGGGFSWFGEAPANQILTSYGLMEFHDMSKVYQIDPKIISRTQAWLAQQQKDDGCWDPDKAYLHQESWGKIQNSGLLVTAYVMWALKHTGFDGPQMQKGFDYMTKHMDEADNAYTLSLMLNAYALDKKYEKELEKVIGRLVDMKKSEGDKVWWEAGVASGTYSHGDSADVETTAMVAIGLMNADQQTALLGKVMNYLIAQKQPNGAWPGTQATILALRAMLISVEKSQAKITGEATVKVGEGRWDFAIDPKTADMYHLHDFKAETKTGANGVSLQFEGEGGMMYQVVTRYYLPWHGIEAGPQEALSIDVKYDKTQLKQDDIVTANVSVRNNAPGEVKMVMIDLGIPPGFQVQTTDLWSLVEQGRVQRFETTGRQVILYIETMKAGETLELSYRMQAQFVIKAKAPKSAVYKYYNPEERTESKPFDIEVN